MKKLITLLVLAAVSVAFVGCSSVTGETVLLSDGVKDSVACTELQDSRLPDGRLQVQARLRNRERYRRIQVQVDCQFKDENGAMIDAAPFQNVMIDESAEEYVKFVSMSDQAHRYIIRVREAR